MLSGIDVSNYQASLDFARVPMDFAVVKVTGGIGYTNPYWRGQCNAAGESGVLRQGLYHFAGDGWEGTSAKAEAEHFMNTVGTAHRGKIIVLDWEQPSLIRNPAWAMEFIERVANWSGKLPMIYANGAALGYDLSRVKNLGVQLWHAYYGNDAVTSGYGPLYARPSANYWGSAMMWQFTQHGRLPGYSGELDLNLFYGTGATWDALANGTVKLLSSTTENDEFMKELMG